MKAYLKELRRIYNESDLVELTIFIWLSVLFTLSAVFVICLPFYCLWRVL